MERESISSDFSLRDDGFFILEKVFNWIFDSDNMLRSEFIDRIEHGCHRRRLSTSSGACYEKESLLCLEYLSDTFWDSEFHEILDIFRDSSKCDRNLSHIHIGIASIGDTILMHESKIDFHIMLEC